MESIKEFKSNLLEFSFNKKPKNTELNTETSEKTLANNSKYLENFKKLVAIFGFDKDKIAILLDSRTTSKSFLEYCETMGYS